MDFNSPLTIVSAFVLCAPCRAIILVKFPQLSEHFTTARMRARHEPDPLKNFGLISRQLLCDAVIEAKQFSAQYNAGYYKTVTGGNVPMVTRTKWDDPCTSGDNILNYQRSLVNYKTANLSALRYLPRPLKFGKGGYERVLALQCVNTMNVKWYIAYGFMDHFMYLFEERSYKQDACLRISGLFEPTPVISNRPAKYFSNQFKSSGKEMEKVCKLRHNDHLRMCGALLDVLNNEGSLDRSIPQMILVKSRARICVNKMIELVWKRANVLRCIFMDEENDDEEWVPFYALADVREPGAVFVFFENKEGDLYLHARVIKITALMYPVGARGRTARAKKDRGKDGSDHGKKKKRRTERDRLEDTGDDDHEMDSKEHHEAEHSNEDTDHEDFIMHLLGKGKDEVEQMQKSPNRQNIVESSTRAAQGTKGARRIQQKSGGGSGSNGKVMSPSKTARGKRGVSSRSKPKAKQNEKQENEDSRKRDTSEKDSGCKVKAKEKEDAEERVYATRYRERKKLQIVEDNEKNVCKNKKADTGDDFDDDPGEDSSDEEDSLDEDYNYERDLKRNAENEEYDYSEDIEDEDLVFGRPTTSKKQVKKYRDKGHSSSGGISSFSDTKHEKGNPKVSRTLGHEDTEMVDRGKSGGNTEDETDRVHKKKDALILEDSSQEDAENVGGDTNTETGEINSSDKAIHAKDVSKTSKTAGMRSRTVLPPSKPTKRKGKELPPETDNPDENDETELSENEKIRQKEAAEILEQFKYEKSTKARRSSGRKRQKKEI